MQPSSRKSVAGISAVELIMIISVAATLGLLASNGIASIIYKARGNFAGIQIVDSLTQARSLATLHETDVVLCPSSDGLECSSGDRWESGWIAFADKYEDGERRNDEPVLLKQGQLGAKVHLISTLGRTRLRFQPNGTSRGSNVTFTLCDGRGPRYAVSWIMANNGNLRSAPAAPAAADLACYGA